MTRAVTVHPGTLEEAMTGVVMEDLAGNELPTRPYGLNLQGQVLIRQILQYARANPAGAMRLVLLHFGGSEAACRGAIEFLTVEMTR